MKFIVFGLGSFGKALAIELTELGHEVIGVDKNMTRVEDLKTKITHTVCMDSTDRDAVSALPIKEVDAAIVAIGEDEAASLLATALLKQLNVKRIIGRVVSSLQRTVLEAMNISEYILPEVDSAERTAIRLDNTGIVDSFRVSSHYSVIEAVVPEKYAGTTIAESGITQNYDVLVLTTIKGKYKDVTHSGKVFKESTGIATMDTILEKGDLIVLFGKTKVINKLIRN